jgi:LysM repeat protein
MARFTLWSRVFWALASFSLGSPTVYALDVPVAAEQVQEEFLEYRLRPGDSLSDIARLFQLPVTELAQVNNIADPTRLRVGQPLKIPNAFARQAVQLRSERNQLLAEKERQRKEWEVQQQTLAAVEAKLQEVEAEKAVLTRDLAATLQWQRSAFLLAVLLVVMFGWGLKLRSDRATLARQLAVATQENAALTVAKEKYRQAAAQVELRYQKLYRLREGVPAKFVADSVATLARTLAEGSARLEHLLANIKAEREREEQLLQAEQKARDFLFHPLRGLLQWYRLKYHEA